ncbi:MAG: BREX-2 system phosphatase PglZ, partial [Planctomycetota bacterium]
MTAIHQKVPQARVIGIRSAGRWTGPAEQVDGELSYSIHQCDSPLAMRVALREPVDEHTTKVLITPLEEGELSEDILLRLAKRRLFQIDTWQIVRSLFQARAIDPRLTRHAWLADALLDSVAGHGTPAARGGFLDSEMVWPMLLRKYVGLEAESPDLTSILKWSLDSDWTSRFRQMPSAFQVAATEWLSEKAGSIANFVLHCVGQLERADAVPLGLAMGVIFHPEAAGRLEKATGKLEERFLGGKTPDPNLMLRWSTAATEVVRGLRHTEPRVCRQSLQRADEILREVQAESFARLSDTSLLGFDQRLARFGQNLAETVARKTWHLTDELRSAHTLVRLHDQSARETRRLERVDMAMRLVRWLAQPELSGETGVRSFAEAAARQLRDGGFVDWA